MLIKDLHLTEIEVKCLQELINSKSVAQIGAMLDISYATASQRMLIWEAKGWVRSFRTATRGKRYVLNKDFFYPKKKEELEKDVDDIIGNKK